MPLPMPPPTPIDRLSRALAPTVGWVFLAAVLVTGYEVMMRYVFGAPTIWAHETTLLLCAIGYLLAGAHTLERRNHIAITLLYDKAPPRLRKALDLINGLIMIGYFLALAWACHRRAWTALLSWEGTGTSFNAPLPAIVMPLLLIAALLLAVQAAANLRADLRR
jgi:TRAP-type C4-dicarboxylate transport system permease small subunit